MHIIDFHMHLPPKPKDPVEAGWKLVESMNKSGVSHSVVIAVETSRKLFKVRMDKKALRKALSESGIHAVMSRWSVIRRIIENPDKVLEEHEYLLVEHRRDNKEILAAAESSGGRLVPVISYNPDIPLEDNVKCIERNKGRVLGLKLFPTFHFIDPGDKKLYPIYQALMDNGMILIVHTGCDPGIWELPSMCKTARPRSLDGVARIFKDLDIVVAHLGSYSLLEPGIFFHESIELGRKHENVYFDTSAIDTYFVGKAVAKLGADRLLFGSDYPYMVGLTLRDIVCEYIKACWSDDVKMRILRENAIRLLGTHGWKIF
ncbi:MAG: amidohydrolase family protein [Desulfurococcales archaeon]|nr:amidohydrolase family protein [Desulfurococcales archaeon]